MLEPSHCAEALRKVSACADANEAARSKEIAAAGYRRAAKVREVSGTAIVSPVTR
jgi:hypothetical protein